MANTGYFNSMGYGNGLSYNYNNGNFSSQSMMMNGVMFQRNILNIGGNCGGNNNCIDGYSLYFPCIKTITRGQNVCFDFFIGDNENQDELDMRDLDDFTLTLSGVFGCPYKTYTYPEDIKSLQTEKYKEILFEDFNEYPSNTCELKIEYIEGNFKPVEEPNVLGEYGKFLTGSEIKLIGDDTPTHIFVGWGVPNNVEIDVNCDEFYGDEYESAYETLVSTDKEYTFKLKEDMTVYAIYRKRKEYEIKISFDNRHSHFEIYYLGKITYLSDKERDSVKVKEGYHFKAVCIPNENFLQNGDFYYVFDKWADGHPFQAREMIADESNPLFDKDKIMLLASCFTSNHEINIINKVDEIEDNFITQKAVMHELKNDIEFKKFMPTENVIEADKMSIRYKSDNGFALMEAGGYFKTNLIDVEEGISVKVKIDSTDNLKKSIIAIEVNGEKITYEIEPGLIMEYECLFRHCNYSHVNVSNDGEEPIYIDSITVYEEVIEDKGRAELCLSSEDTALMHAGVLNASGAISVGGRVFGINQTLMGNINNLRTINVL